MSEERERPGFFEALRNRVVAPTESDAVPSALRITASYSWRLLVIAGAAAVLIWLIMQLKLIVIPLMISLLLCALLQPLMVWLLRRRVPRWLAVVISVVCTLAVVTGLLWLAIWQISQQWKSVEARTVESVNNLRDYLISGPLHLTTAQIDDYLKQAWTLIQEQTQFLVSGAVAVGSTVGHVATGVLLSLFILLCLLADGAGIWKWTLRIFPKRARRAVDSSARAGWRTVINYTHTQALVASIDAVGIGLGAFLLGVPLAVPIGVLVFLGSFVPIVGAVLTGTLAVFLALVYNGPLIALWMLIVVLGVQQLEGHVLQPILMGSAVKVHPLAVVLVVAGGAMIAGIPGALFAVPLAAFVNVVAISISSGAWRGGVLSEEQLIWRTVPRERPTSSARAKRAR